MPNSAIWCIFEYIVVDYKTGADKALITANSHRETPWAAER